MNAGTVKTSWWELLSIETVGQAIYVAVMASPDGLDSRELVERVQESQPELDGGKVLCVAVRLQASGYLRLDGVIWRAPGPIPAIWEML